MNLFHLKARLLAPVLIQKNRQSNMAGGLPVSESEYIGPATQTNVTFMTTSQKGRISRVPRDRAASIVVAAYV